MTVFARSFRHISSSRSRSSASGAFSSMVDLDELAEPDVRDLAVPHRVERAVHRRALRVEHPALERDVHPRLLRHARLHNTIASRASRGVC